MKTSVLVWFFVLAVGLGGIWPVVRRPATALAFGGDDGIIIWQMNQTIGWLAGERPEFWDGNIFYPYRNTVAMSMLMVPSAILGFLPVKISGNPVAAYNTAMIVSQVMCLSVMFWWFREMTRNEWAAMIGSLAVGMSQIRMFFDVHIHMWLVQWFLLSAWMLWKYSREKKVWQLYAAGIFTAIQFWENAYAAYWIIFFAAVFLIPNFKNLWGQRKHVLAVLALAGVMVWPAAAAYMRVAREFGNAGSIREAAHFSMSVDDLGGKFFSLGLEVLVLVAMLRTRKGMNIGRDLKWLWGLVIFGIVMALGPVLKWGVETVKLFGTGFVPLPYGLFYYLVPGISALRSVHRYIFLAGLGFGGLAALGLSGFRPKGWVRATAMGGMLTLAVLGGGKLLPRGDFPVPAEYPAVYGWLEQAPGKVIFEYPVYTWEDKNFREEMFRMVYSLKHGKALVGGAVGFMPPERAELLAGVMKEFPDNGAVTRLRAIGTDYVVVHKAETEKMTVGETEENPEMIKVWEDGNEVVFQL